MRRQTSQSNSKSNSKLDNIPKDLNSALRSQSNSKSNSSVLRSQNSRSNVLNSVDDIDNLEDISKVLKETIDIFAKNCCNEIYSNTELQIRIKKIVESRRTEGLKIY
jgi:hypothetical protein